MKVAITGGTGFLGRALEPVLRARGYEVVRITRGHGDRRAGDVIWDPMRDALDPAALAGIGAILNLAGESIGERWTTERKRRMRDSRVRGTRLISRVAAALVPRPGALISASGVGIYGDRGDEILEESNHPGTGFLAELAVEWEAATAEAKSAGIRVVLARSGLVLSPKGGLLHRVLPLFRLGIGGHIGSGRQWMSWISLTDWLATVLFLLEKPVSGPANIVAPNPATNAEFTRVLGKQLGRPTVATVPAMAVRLALGREMAEETALVSQRAVPRVLERAGFAFTHPTVDAAVAAEMTAR